MHVNKERRYKLLVVMLAIALCVSAFFNIRQEAGSMEGAYMMLSLLVDMGSDYERICQTYGDILTREDFEMIQKINRNSSRNYTVSLKVDEKDDTMLLIQYAPHVGKGDHQIINVKAVPEEISNALLSCLYRSDILPK